MNATLLRGRGSKAEASSAPATILRAPRADSANGDRTANGIGRTIGTSYIVLLGALLGFSAVAVLLELSTFKWPLDATARSHNDPRASIASPSVSMASARPTPMNIMPAPATDSGLGHFVGTGDGSAGSWIEP